MIKVSLWKNTTKEGKPYISGKAFGLKVLIFPTEEKKSENSPDYTLIVDSPREARDEEGDKQQQADF